MEKDPLSYSIVTYLWVVFLSSWGGIVSFNGKLRKGKAQPFNFMELIGEISTSAFAGILTFWLCESADIQPLIGAAMVGISGHMGSRIMWRLEKWAERKINSLQGVDK